MYLKEIRNITVAVMCQLNSAITRQSLPKHVTNKAEKICFLQFPEGSWGDGGANIC